MTVRVQTTAPLRVAAEENRKPEMNDKLNRVCAIMISEKKKNSLCKKTFFA